jgi:hypothetical protein
LVPSRLLDRSETQLTAANMYKRKLLVDTGAFSWGKKIRGPIVREPPIQHLLLDQQMNRDQMVLLEAPRKEEPCLHTGSMLAMNNWL